MRRPKKRGRLRASRKVNIHIDIPMQFVPIEVQTDATEKVTTGKVCLLDLNAEGVGLFTSEAIDRGAAVTVVIHEPREVFVKGRVISCLPYTWDKRIITADNTSFRVKIQFHYNSDAEKANVQKFCAEITGQDDLEEEGP